MPPVVVVDSIMGSGKTSYIIDHMNKAHNDALIARLDDPTTQLPRFLYITPRLDETKRIKEACPALWFKDPVPEHGSKYYNFDKLIDAGQNIASTHKLFSEITGDTLGKLKAQGYTLVIDEVLTCVDHFDALTKSDLLGLFALKWIYVDDTNHLRWNNDKFYKGKFDRIRHLCNNGNLIAWSMERGGFVPGKRGSILLWAFPTEFLEVFKEVYILTYLFHGSPMRSYFEMEGIAFDMRTVTDKGKALVPWTAAVEREANSPLLKCRFDQAGSSATTINRTAEPSSDATTRIIATLCSV